MPRVPLHVAPKNVPASSWAYLPLLSGVLSRDDEDVTELPSAADSPATSARSPSLSPDVSLRLASKHPPCSVGGAIECAGLDDLTIVATVERVATAAGRRGQIVHCSYSPPSRKTGRTTGVRGMSNLRVPCRYSTPCSLVDSGLLQFETTTLTLCRVLRTPSVESTFPFRSSNLELEPSPGNLGSVQATSVTGCFGSRPRH